MSTRQNGKTQDELVNEIADIAIKTQESFGGDIPLGASLKTPIKKQLLRLKEARIAEMRLDLETYNMILAHQLMPNKDVIKILCSIKDAVNIFGKEKGSSNIIIGLGESDDDILDEVNKLAEIGALSTLYPYDVIENLHEQFKHPLANRIYYLATEHKKFCKNIS